MENWHRLALKSVPPGHSNNSCSDMNVLFGGMFSDSKIAKDPAMSEDKLRYTIKYGLAHILKVFCKTVFRMCCSSIWQECTLENSRVQAELIRFLKENLGKVETCYWHSQFINHSTANDILEHFYKSGNIARTMLNLEDNAKLRQISMDGNIKKLETVRFIEQIKGWSTASKTFKYWKLLPSYFT